MNRILITGASGKTGRRLVSQLRGMRIRPRQALRTAKGEDAVRFDWMAPETHLEALDGVRAVYLVAPPGVVDPLPVMLPFLQRALQLGVTRFVLLSASSLDEGGPMMGQVHGWLRSNVPSWTVLRPSWFMQNFSEQQHLPTIVGEDAIYSATGDGRVGFIDAEDIAAVASVALTEPNFKSGDLVLTGPGTLSYDEVAAVISRTTGRDIRHRRLTGQQMTDRFVSFGVPAGFASGLAEMDLAIATGAEDRTTENVSDVTGLPARSFQDFVTRNATAWAKSAL
ncbi:NAD(P)H-binding protein [Mesorhizobium sp. CAU 1741]|uniref:NmrA family NAD(P)-binding protein n=1 Tax=Mesorhizobium sp. CAU 1741 TaxID=3140366 RepID=UPI00325AEA32